MPSSPAGTCPVCLGYGWHPESISTSGNVQVIMLSRQRCACCDGTGNLDRKRKRHPLVRWLEGM